MMKMTTGGLSMPSIPMDRVPRRSVAPARLLLAAIGGPRQVLGKTRRLAATVRLYLNGKEIERRLARLHQLGFIDQIPTRLQLFAGGLDMLRFFIVPAARDYYATKGINFTFHQILRFLDDPVSLADPVGFLSERDSIIGHLMQVVHADPIYDLQLLQMFDDGLDQLEHQIGEMIAGTHPRAGTIGAIIEDAGYHRRLLSYVRAYRADPNTPRLRREDGGLRSQPEFLLVEETFAAMPSFMRYASRLPRSPAALARHYFGTKAIDPRYCDPRP